MEDYIYYATPPPETNPLMQEFNNRPRRLIAGGFGEIEDPPKAVRKAFHRYPPPANSYYEVDSHCRLPHLQ